LISYVINEDTFLIVNREICSKDVTSFDFKPTEGIETTVTIFNEKNEESSLRKFFNHIRSCKPLIITSYNGDFFDFPFIEKRAEKYGMTLEKEIGIN
jgi:DNA polymerase epsilon subunit 1